MENPFYGKTVSHLSVKGMRDFNHRELVSIFAEDGAYCPSVDTWEENDHNALNNTLHLCTNACLDEERNLLVFQGCIPKDFPSDHNHRSLFIREAYKDHWEIIKEILERKHNQCVFISGDCGSGKSVEAYYLLYQILNSFSNAPAVIYTDSRRFKHFVLHYRGFIFEGSDYRRFIKSRSHRIIECTEGQLWHLSDNSGAGPFLCGPEIVFTSPEYERHDGIAYESYPPNTLYLPLPDLSEMESIKHAISEGTGNLISEEKMLDLIDKYGCNPKTVFHYGDRQEALKAIDERIEFSTGWQMLDIFRDIWGSVSLITSNWTLQIVPYYQEKDWNPFRPGWRNTEKLEDKYTQFDYQWGSRATEDRAFQTLIQYDRPDIESISHIYTHSQIRNHIGLLMEPFARNLLTITAVVGRARNLMQYDGKHQKLKLGPWQSNIYRRHSDIDISKGVCNTPHRGVYTQIAAIVPAEGLIFGIGKYKNRGINKTEIDDVFKANVFREFSEGYPRKSIRMVWIVESQEYETFSKQRLYQEENGKEKRDENISNQIEQWAFEVDVTKISEFERARKHGTVVNMTAKRRWKMIAREVKYHWNRVDDSFRWSFYRFRGVIGL